jgi:type IV pilus assembly protein PilY1
MNFFNNASKLFSPTLLMGMASFAHAQIASDYAASPAFVTDSSDPVVVINLSVELTQQAEAFTGAAQTYAGGTVCPGRLSGRRVCYTAAEQYIGYFDAEKCYVYEAKGGGNAIIAGYDTDNITQLVGTDLTATTNRSTDYFKPVGAAASRSCSGNQFSGNFMNWATMTALDEFRFAMVGGSRLVDTVGSNPQTLLTRTHRYGDWGFAEKRISTAGLSGFTTNPASVTPFNETQLRVINNNGNNGNRVTFQDGSGTTLAELSVIVEVCNESAGLEANCISYTDGTNTWYKPEGVMQRNAPNMKFALLSYTGQDGNRRNGGVLRSNAKYIGYLAPQPTGGLAVNVHAETNELGQHVKDPNCILTEHTSGCSLASTAFTPGDGVSNSGIINYINAFGLSGGRYKSNDPIGELFYEGFRYLATEGTSRVPVPEYYLADGAGLGAITGANQKDNFPIIDVWDDPVLDQCQLNYMINVGDQFAWGDNSFPGSTIGGTGVPISSTGAYTAIAALNANSVTDMVGTLEYFYSGSLGAKTRSRDNNNWMMAGLAYYANTEDVRDDVPGVQRIKSFFVDTQEYSTSAPQKQNNPLWLAAKYGGFEDDNDDKDPGNGSAGSVTDEWDEDGNGVPDTYTLSSQPANLIRGLNNAFNNITGNLRAGSAAAISTTSSGEGILVQGIYKPSNTDENGRQVQWVGILQSLFIDGNNNFREDTDNNALLTNDDAVVQFRSEISATGDDSGVFDRFTTTDGGLTLSTAINIGVDIEELDTLWNARDELGELSDVTTQRAYAVSASTGRYIFTAIDGGETGVGADGEITQEDFVNFTAAQFPDSAADNNFRYLGLNSLTRGQAPDVVNYIRGKEITGYRSRTTDYDGDATTDEVWRLGDIVSSSPLLVARPNARYDITYGDASYAGFRNKYFDRRQVVYTGANDGMLHAFNAGFYDATNQRFETQLDAETAHPLGSELWAYVPHNVLPHLQWLTQLDYPHSFYVDGIPQSYDVNIFDPSDKHPNGWGTILVVGLSFGGGDYTFDPDGDGFDADTTDDVTTRSSYIILDITDPESAPELVAEISDPNMGYTTSRPTLIKNRRANDSTGSFVNPEVNDWYLVFGSGPYGSDATAKKVALDFAVSDQTGKIFIFDLQSKSFEGPSAATTYFDVAEAATGFIGDISSVDWNNDYADDAVYFGTVRDGVNDAEGDLMRLPLEFGASGLLSPIFSKVLSSSGTDSMARPFTGAPLLSRDAAGNAWIYAGSGRFFTSKD